MTVKELIEALGKHDQTKTVYCEGDAGQYEVTEIYLDSDDDLVLTNT